MKSAIDMSKPNAIYMSGIGFLMLTSVVLSNVPWLSPSNYLFVPHKQLVSVLCFLLGGLFGMLTLWRHTSRGKTPWKVPQVQVTLAYGAFFFFTLVAVLLAR